ncbi:MAG: metallophosphoesterase [Pseudomonadota bacterium]
MSNTSFASCFVAPPPDNNQDLVIYAGGDTRSNPPILEKSFKAILNDLKKSHYSSPTLFLHVGDWIDNGNKEQNWYQEFFAVDFPGIPLFLSQIPILGVRGNHDGNTELFKKYYPYNYASKEGIYYSQKFGPVEIIAIDQYVPLSEDSEQYRWLEKTLAQSKQKFKIAFFHAPLWSAGGHINEKEILQAQNDLHPLFIKYGVKLVLSGHNHYYSRSLVEGIHYLTVGTMGAPLMEPKKAFNQQKYFKGFHFCKISYFGGLWSNKIKIEIKDLDGKLIEEFSFSL